MWQWRSIWPGITHIPEASRISASAGRVTSPCFPRAAILPFRITSTPFSMTPLVTVRMRPALMTSGFAAFASCAATGRPPPRASAAASRSRPPCRARESGDLFRIVDHLSVYEDFFHTAGEIHGISVENDQVGVLPGFDAAEMVFHMEDAGRIERQGAQGFGRVEAVADGVGGVQAQELRSGRAARLKENPYSRAGQYVGIVDRLALIPLGDVRAEGDGGGPLADLVHHAEAVGCVHQGQGQVELILKDFERRHDLIGAPHMDEGRDLAPEERGKGLLILILGYFRRLFRDILPLALRLIPVALPFAQVALILRPPLVVRLCRLQHLAEVPGLGHAGRAALKVEAERRQLLDHAPMVGERMVGILNRL